MLWFLPAVIHARSLVVFGGAVVPPGSDPSMVSCSNDGIWVLVMEVPRRFPAVIHMIDPAVCALEVPRRFSGSDPVASF